MKLILPKGATSVSVDVFIRDSSVTTGAGLTGLAYNTGSLVAYYRRPGVAATAITLATLASATAAWSSGGFVVVDGTNMPGLYRLDIPDAVLASGVNQAVIMLRGATNMEPCTLEIQLSDVNLNDAVRAGLTALPNVASGSAGAIVTSGTGTAQISTSSGQVLLQSGTGTGQVTITSGRVNADVTHIATAAVSTSTAQLGVNVVNFGGAAGTFASGRPEVNASHAGGTAWGSGAITSGAFATGAITAGAIAADAIGASELAADAVTEIRDAVAALVVESEGSYTLKQVLSLSLAALAGRTNTGGTVFNTPNNLATRITATVDGSNNRTAMTLNPSA